MWQEGLVNTVFLNDNFIKMYFISLFLIFYIVFRFHRSYLTNEKWQKESIHEAEVLTYWVKYPTLQRMSGRNLKHSPIHQKMAENGAFFGSAGGYERPLFFLKNNKQLEVHIL